MSKIINGDNLTLGTCYYPEHWPERLWAEDMRRMAAHGISLIRIAEFAWNLIEPQEGGFNFDFFDRVLDCAQAAGLGVVMGTPTATPPAVTMASSTGRGPVTSTGRALSSVRIPWRCSRVISWTFCRGGTPVRATKGSISFRGSSSSRALTKSLLGRF